jgi:methylglutaconyl-CoA hydratase
MSQEQVLYSKDSRGVATVTLNRPEVHNAFDDNVIASLTNHLETAAADSEVRIVVLRSNGKNFSAGGDLNWMRRMAANSHAENIEDARGLGRLMQCLNDLPKPTIALVQGAAYGGAVGLTACCDIAVATEASKFCLSEVKIGLMPAVISPYVVRAIGERQSRRFFLTAEVFDAVQAHEFGLVHQLVNSVDGLDDAKDALVKQLLGNSPQAVGEAKSLIFAVSNKPIDEAVIEETVTRIADIRASEEGQEGLNAFLEKRKPSWITDTAK